MARHEAQKAQLARSRGSVASPQLQPPPAAAAAQHLLQKQQQQQPSAAPPSAFPRTLSQQHLLQAAQQHASPAGRASPAVGGPIGMQRPESRGASGSAGMQKRTELIEQTPSGLRRESS